MRWPARAAARARALGIPVLCDEAHGAHLNWDAEAPTAGALGAAYIKDVKGPLKQACIMAVGGVSLENTADLFRAGASCVGVGSNLVSKALIQSGSFDGITERAKAFTEAAK